ncbi:hypothetical protein [Paraclostridium tenue]|uniref:Uncharacterized protein n=1 Tax=Paraclostridium tenue TaxID=1737 RepID=A0ABP3X7L4_9FIRM
MSSTKVFPGKLKKYELIGLYIYYSLICFLAICVSIFVIASNNLNISLFPSKLNYFLYGEYTIKISSKLNLYNLAFIGSISSALLGSSITYIKKLYVFSLGNIFDLNVDNEEDKVNEFGTIIYFLFRPVFAAIFSIVTFLGLKIGIIPLINNNSDISSIVYMYMFISFFIGFGAGNVLSGLEKNCDSLINNAIDSIKKTAVK